MYLQYRRYPALGIFRPSPPSIDILIDQDANISVLLDDFFVAGELRDGNSVDLLLGLDLFRNLLGFGGDLDCLDYGVSDISLAAKDLLTSFCCSTARDFLQPTIELA